MDQPATILTALILEVVMIAWFLYLDHRLEVHHRETMKKLDQISKE